jgi:hypothetical protein
LPASDRGAEDGGLVVSVEGGAKSVGTYERTLARVRALSERYPAPERRTLPLTSEHQKWLWGIKAWLKSPEGLTRVREVWDQATGGRR